MEERILQPPGVAPRRLVDVLFAMAIWRNLGLVRSLTARELEVRYRGSWLGFCWPVLQPLLLLAVYTFVFSFVFGASWPGIYDSDIAGYAVIVFTGLVTFNIFAESVRACPKLILAHRNFVQRVVFPLEVLPVVQIAAACVHAAAGLGVLLVFLVASGVSIGWTALWLPVVWAFFAVFSLGVCYAVAAISVSVRDLEPLVGIGMTGLFFASGIFYPLERLPDDVEAWIRLVPTAAAVDVSRSVLLLGVAPSPEALLGPGAVSFVVFLLGYAIFLRSREGFADAL
ncbi:MAG: ABC transporter permease [bacterium]|nr:ABC transporter permease [bacterium]